MGQVMKSPIDHPPSNYERLRQIIAERCFTKGQPFQLSSGRMSNFYFNLKPAMLDPEGLDLLADIILERIAGIDARYIGGLAMGAVPLAIAVLLKSNATARPLQGFWVRKEAKGHGTKNLNDGYIQDGARGILAEDVTNNGDSVMQAINESKRRGCDVAAVITIGDRLQGAEERLAQNGVKLTALFTAKDFT